MTRDYTLYDKISAIWFNTSRPEQRTMINWQSFYRRMLHNLGARGIHRAQYDAAGNCTECGEAGRCPGSHYEGEIQ